MTQITRVGADETLTSAKFPQGLTDVSPPNFSKHLHKNPDST